MSGIKRFRTHSDKDIGTHGFFKAYGIGKDRTMTTERFLKLLSLLIVLSLALLSACATVERDRYKIEPSDFKTKLSRKAKVEAKKLEPKAEKVRLSIILVESRAEASKVIHKLRQGENFNILASKYSKVPSIIEVGYFSKGELIRELDNIAFKLEVGEVSKPIETNKGFFIILRIDREKTVVTKVTDGFKPLIEFSFGQMKDLNKNGMIEVGELIAVEILVENKGEAVAKNVEIKLWGIHENTGNTVIPENIELIDYIQPDEKKHFSLVVKVSQTTPKNKIIIKGSADIVKSNIKSTKKLVKIQDKENRTLLCNIIDEATIDKCKSYLSKYPHSYYANAVSDVMDNLMWKEATSINTIDSYQRYCEDRCDAELKGKYCDQSYVRIKRLRIASIQKQKEIEELYWSELEKEYKIEKFQKYIEECDKGKYTGKYREQATRNIEEIKAFNGAKKKDTYRAYKEVVGKYSKSRYAPDEAKKRTKLTYWKGRKQTPHTLCQIAEIYMDLYGNSEKAIEYYKKALSMDSNYVVAHEGLGKIYFDYGNMKKAKNNFEEAVQLGINNYEAYYYLGRIYENINNKIAIDHYTKAIKLNPICSQCYYNRGVRCIIALLKEPAKKDFKRVIEIEEMNGNGSSILADMARKYLEELGG